MNKLIPLLLLAVVFTAGCDLTGLTVTTSAESPVISSFDADSPTIAAGESSTLSWSVVGATAVSIDQGIGNVALTGRRAVVPSATTIYTLTATNAAGMSATATAQVIVSGAPSPPANLPVVNYFTAAPPVVSAGSSAVLNWNVSNATSVTINPGVGTFASSGTTIVLPAATTTYILTATNAAGNTTEMTQITVSGTPSPSAGMPVVSYFTANPLIISAGSSTTLSWSVSNATSVDIQPGVGSVGLVGTAVVSPAANTDYTLTAINGGWVYYMTITVLVTGAPSADTTPPSVPMLLSPSSGATIPQPSSAWTFDWADSSDPESGISQYQLYVIHTGAVNPAIDVYVTASSYSQTLGGSITTPNLTNWRWRVRAQNNVGLWSAWSADRIFDVQAPSADTTPPSVPVLLSPSSGATMPQPSSAWTFDWADSSDPESGISQYQLYVIHTGAVNPAIDVYVITSSYSTTLGGSITTSNLTNWRWRVRAQNNVGLWSAWSADMIFNVQAP